MKTDQFDKHILRLLQQNNRFTSDELAHKVGLSPSAIQRRLKRLRNEKIIEADVSIISPTVAGIGLTCIVEIALVSDGSRSLEKFKSSIVECSEVMQCYYVTGTFDFIMIINTQTMEHYEAFTKKWFSGNPEVKHFYTHVVMDKVKVGFGVSF